MSQIISCPRASKYFPILEYIQSAAKISPCDTYAHLYEIYYDHEDDLCKLLNLIKAKLEKDSIANNFFSFKVHPGIESEKIHVISLILDIKVKEQKYSWAQAKKIAPLLQELNKACEPFLVFEGNADPLIRVTRLWQKNPTSVLWHTG